MTWKVALVVLIATVMIVVVVAPGLTLQVSLQLPPDANSQSAPQVVQPAQVVDAPKLIIYAIMAAYVAVVVCVSLFLCRRIIRRSVERNRPSVF